MVLTHPNIVGLIYSRDFLFTPESVFILKIIVEFHDICNSHFLRKEGKSNLPVSTVYYTADSFTSNTDEFEATTADQFMNCLYFDDKRDLLRKKKAEGKRHTMLLNFLRK